MVDLVKIGLGPAVRFASRGHEVLDACVNASICGRINSGQKQFSGEAYPQETLAEAKGKSTLMATTHTAVVAENDSVFVVVQQVVDRESLLVFGWMDSATRSIPRGRRAAAFASSRHCTAARLDDGLRSAAKATGVV